MRIINANRLREKLIELRDAKRNANECSGCEAEVIDTVIDMLDDEPECLNEIIEAAERDIKIAERMNETCCVCANYIDCSVEDCELFEEYEDGTSCFDLDFGQCKAMKDTPCSTCDLRENFRWRGRMKS